MCLDVDSKRRSQNLLENTGVYQDNQEFLDVNMEPENSIQPNLNLKSLCGGNLINHKPVFDPNGE